MNCVSFWRWMVCFSVYHFSGFRAVIIHTYTHIHTNNVYINSQAMDMHMLIFILVVDNEWECGCEILAIKLIFVSNKSLYYWWEFSIFKIFLWNCIKSEMYVCLNVVKYTVPASNRHRYTGSSFDSIALNQYMKYARVYVFASFIIRLKWTEIASGRIENNKLRVTTKAK